MAADLRAEFHLASPSLPLVGLAATITNARIRLDEVLRTDVDRAVFLCWIEAEDAGPVERALDADTSIAGWTLLEGSDSRHLYRLGMAGATDLQIAIEAPFVERGVTPIDATITSEGWLVRGRFPDRATLAEYRRDCERRGMTFRLDQLYESTTDDRGPDSVIETVTPKQREALLLAYDEGYYDLPRGTTLAALGDRLDISRRSVSERLRRAERTVIGAALTDERLAHRDQTGS